MSWVPSVLRKPRPVRRGGVLTGDHFNVRERIVQTEPLYSQMIGGDVLDAGQRLGEMGQFHRACAAALGDKFAVRVDGLLIRREAAGGISVSCTFPPGAPDASAVMSSGFTDAPPAGWWLDDGSPAPGTPEGPPMLFPGVTRDESSKK